MRPVGLVLALLLLAGLARAQGAPSGTLLQAAQAVQSGARGLAGSVEKAAPRPTWGQSQALGDLGSLAAAAEDLAGDLVAGEAGGLRDRTARLEVARTRVRTSLPLLDLEEARISGPALLDLAGRLVSALRGLDQRFSGRAPVSGPRLGGVLLDEAGRPLVYDSPEALLREARGLRSAAEQMRADLTWARIPGARGRGSFRQAPDPFREEDLRDLVRAASDFEAEVAGGYEDVTTTGDAFQALRRAWQRTLPYVGGSFGSFAAGDLERAMRRLEAFYSEVQR